MVWQSLAFMMACYCLLFAGLALWWTLLPTSVADGQCEGLGWGCTLSPQDRWLFGAFILGPSFLAVALLASAVMLWFTLARTGPQAAWAIGTKAALTGWLVGFVAIFCGSVMWLM